MRIGELARRTGVQASTLRYYESKGLVAPVERTDAGYRSYGPDAIARVQLIQRAQRIGLRLSDIRDLLQEFGTGDSSRMREILEDRFVHLEREVARLVVQRHELQALLDELRDGGSASRDGVLSRLTTHVCLDPSGVPRLGTTFQRLAQRFDCALADADSVIAGLAGGHYHVWETARGYAVLAVDPDQDTRRALTELVAREERCATHPTPRLKDHRDGVLLYVHGDAAFLYASLFVHLDES